MYTRFIRDCEVNVEVLRRPTEDDWERCKQLALQTVGKFTAPKAPDVEWKHKMLECRHSPIRTLWFTIRLDIPYYVSVHLSRHKFGVEHYVQSQRNDRQSEYDRNLAPQGTMVSHVLDINAEALMHLAEKRLCGMADATTRYVVQKLCRAVIQYNPEFEPFLVPQCERMLHCPEMRPCGYWDKVAHGDVVAAISKMGLDAFEVFNGPDGTTTTLQGGT